MKMLLAAAALLVPALALAQQDYTAPAQGSAPAAPAPAAPALKAPVIKKAEAPAAKDEAKVAKAAKKGKRGKKAKKAAADAAAPTK